MASLRDHEANQKLKNKSQEPIPPESYKHSLTGHGVVLPERHMDDIYERMVHWRKDFSPDSPCQEWQYIRVCIESVQADICLHQLVALRGRESWDDDRTLEARKLYDKLSKKPEIIQIHLMQTKQGYEVLIESWETIARELRQNDGQPNEAIYERG